MYNIDYKMCENVSENSEKEVGVVKYSFENGAYVFMPKDANSKADKNALEALMTVVSYVGFNYTNVPYRERIHLIKQLSAAWIVVEEF